VQLGGADESRPFLTHLGERSVAEMTRPAMHPLKIVVAALVAFVAAMAVLGGVAWAANIQCPNAGIDRTPTPVGQVAIRLCDGTEKADTMRGTKYADRMSGKSGADTMYGRAKYDEMFGGLGPD
jgi:Ca2+-binding RTX toxin-like protein